MRPALSDEGSQTVDLGMFAEPETSISAELINRKNPQPHLKDMQ